MELCLTTYWSELKGVSLCLRLCFHGILPSTPTLVFVSSILNGGCVFSVEF